ncbi:MAG: MBOAT family protein [Bacteroidetes bacterium]|nr:MAG: MBOAT family protein [Bacteroidota bacterium]
MDFLFYREDSPLLFTQAIFWIFFTIVLIVYQFLYSKINLRNHFLMWVSMYFYYLTGGYFFTLLVFSTLVDYFIGKKIYETDSQKLKKQLVFLSVFVNLAVLAYFKYTYFFVDGLNFLFETDFQASNFLSVLSNEIADTEFNIHKIILPVGISFYTFQTISYSVDIYRGQLKPVKSMADFAFFVSFFPQLVAGPIVRASDFIPQIYEEYKLSEQEFGRAIFLIINGLIKKILISDYLSTNFVDRVFSDPNAYSGFENLTAVYGYSIQIYCDFSGYTDIAIGLSLLLGFRLPINFNSPYKSLNITEFWRRWHISLSSWLRDYLYISLGGNRHGKFKTYLFLFTTMLLGGLWHGASVRFIIWGALHGIALAVHKWWLEIYPKAIDNQRDKIISGFITFHFVAFCWIFFRAEDMQKVGDILSNILFNFRADLIAEVLFSYKNIFAVMILGYGVHWLPSEWKIEIARRFNFLPDLTKAIVIVGIILMLFQIRTSEIQPFIYFQF